MKTAIANRLATYRQWAADSKHTNDWRKFTWVTNRTRTGYRKNCQQFTYGENGKIYADEKETIGEYLGDWESFATCRDMRNTSGFYADGWCDDTIKGGVLRIRSAKGTFYAPLTYCTGWGGVIIYMNDAELVPKGATESEHETAQKDAASSAFYRADREAEKYREDNAKAQAEEQIAEARAEIHAINKKTRALLAEIRTAGIFSPAICEALTDKVRDMLSDRKKCFKLIAEREYDFWSAVPV